MILCLALSSFKTFLIELIVGLPRASVWLFGIAWTMEYHMLTSSHLGQGQTCKQAQHLVGIGRMCHLALSDYPY